MSRFATLVVLAFLIVSCGQATASTSPASPSTSSTPAVEVRVADFKITPAEVRVGAGVVTLAVANDGPTPHNLTIRDAAGALVMATPEIRPGASETLSGAIAGGTNVLFCSLPGHESLGMRAMLVIGGG